MLTRFPRPRSAAPPVVLVGGLGVSIAAAATLAEPRLEHPAAKAALMLALSAALLLTPLFPLLLALVVTIPFADWKPPGSPLSITVLLAFLLAFRTLVELPALRPFRHGLIVRWLAVPLLLVPSAFVGAAPLAQRGQVFLSIASWFAIALLCAHFIDERRWRWVRAVLVAELVIALVIGGLEILAGRWLVPLPDPPQIHAEFFFGFFRPRSIALSPYALGEFLAFTAPLVWYELGQALRRDPVRKAAWWAALATGQLALLVATLSRKSIWQVAVSAVVFLIVSLGDRSVRGRILLVFAGIGVISVLAVYVNGTALTVRLTSTTSAESVSTRINTFSDAVRIGDAHMPLGAGLGNFVATSTDRYGEQLAAYNSFAEAFSDSGLLGLLAVVVLVLVPIGAAARVGANSVPPSTVVVPILAGLLALAMVESSIWRKSIAVSAGLCLALYVNGRERPRGGPVSAERS